VINGEDFDDVGSQRACYVPGTSIWMKRSAHVDRESSNFWHMKNYVRNRKYMVSVLKWAGTIFQLLFPNLILS